MNPPCKHCFRGKQQDIMISEKSIDSLLNQTEMIGSLFFTGGEPTLAIDKMQYFLKKIYKNKIPLFEFELISNGLVYNDEIVAMIKSYSQLVKMCCEVVEQGVDITNHVVLGISMDRYHNYSNIVERNFKEYKEALQGYAQVVKVAQGNTPRKEGNGAQLKDGFLDLGFNEAVHKRVEILDKDHKPRCPQYKTYRLIKPEQIKICCDMYLSAKGNLLTAALGLHGYYAVDFEKCIICNVNESNIYESILTYNKGKMDCLSLAKQSAIKRKDNPLSELHDVLFFLKHSNEDNSDVIKKDIPEGYIPISQFNAAVTFDDTLCEEMINLAESFNYNNF